MLRKKDLDVESDRDDTLILEFMYTTIERDPKFENIFSCIFKI